MTTCKIFNTKWDEVLLSTTKVPDEVIMENMHKKQLHFCEDLKPLIALYLQDTVQTGEVASYSLD